MTGVPIKEDQRQRVTIQDSAGATKLVLVDGDLVSTPASVSWWASTDKSQQLRAQAIQIIAPVIAGFIGLVLLVAGLVLSRRHDEDEYEDTDDYDDGTEPYGSPA